MKVYPGSEIKELTGLLKKQASRSTQETGKAQDGDKVDFSSTLQQIQGQSGDVTSDPVRQARVQAVKEQIAN
ncbi:MAG: flagellar biosynthesis anti-sigma factor FlgM, partial [Desulfohalobiaceae bacterium]|nr:flagellar biosynthesis anti-sigma factor FlgM [Desulfohalobiaceae bacterium]